MKNLATLFALGVLAVVLVGCDTTRFVIDAGEHDSGNHVALFQGDHMEFRARFDQSAIYETQDPANQADINKLRGFSDCTSDHQTNSARFGWRWYEGTLEIHAYTYVHGVRASELLGSVALDSWNRYRIDLDGDHYRFTLNDTTLDMPRGCDGNGGVKYQLYPYFGGDETAPHEITIRFE